MLAAKQFCHTNCSGTFVMAYFTCDNGRQLLFRESRILVLTYHNLGIDFEIAFLSLNIDFSNDSRLTPTESNIVAVFVDLLHFCSSLWTHEIKNFFHSLASYQSLCHGIIKVC